ncbi:MAG TPA: hypothetical protein VN088_17640, partial [Nocardioides sp.]|nr:hypothetical protein [Nocardioides sp.]
MSAIPGLRTSAEAVAVQLHYQGKPMSQIMINTGLNREQILAAIDDDTERRPPAPLPAPLPAPRPAPAPTRPPAAPAPAPRPDPAVMTQDAAAASLGITTPGALLKWAAAHPDKRVQAIGTRVRDGLDELRDRHAAEEKTREAAAEVDRLTAELEAAKERLRAAGGTPA